ncbi:hypothetical protein DBR32_15465 [Taibaiella sp. KBW10]|uniref:MarR family winged helix-turn-helix transcriptional regulator n=1 Tax=Taibaiella sp. KBW10 TaxID=2153357 RepID=UPI000F5994C1|nr:MarR family transcriptional regulator [Taibaiella sp. KBW10]RQO29655.1 hypothetical protein DBR32_15465 [Taibaiella sp. KBW10]
MEHTKIVIDTMYTLSISVRKYFHKKLALLNLDITYEMIRLLAILSRNNYMNQQEIADISTKNKASLTSLLDNMQKRELIVRTEDDLDRRNKIISLTAKGKAYMKEVSPVVNTFFQLVEDHIGKQEMERMNKTIMKINQLLNV